MHKSTWVLLATVFVSFLSIRSINAQERKGSITGHLTDINHDPLVGARVTLEPIGYSTATDAQGQFTISDLQPNKYTLTVSYVGFKTFSKEVTVTSSGAANMDAVLEIATVSEEVIVRGERERGEVEALNRERTADNIVQVLPADVITSLPNTNIADAVGRLPSVSLERDEGEGKYVQIRGTEPRLSNVTIDGVHVPSPEGVRNVKLDAIPADLVDSVEINKTLSANQEGDAIGGSVNLVTKKPGEQPYISLNAMGGFTPFPAGARSSSSAARMASASARSTSSDSCWAPATTTTIAASMTSNPPPAYSISASLKTAAISDPSSSAPTIASIGMTARVSVLPAAPITNWPRLPLPTSTASFHSFMTTATTGTTPPASALFSLAGVPPRRTTPAASA